MSDHVTDVMIAGYITKEQASYLIYPSTFSIDSEIPMP